MTKMKKSILTLVLGALALFVGALAIAMPKTKDVQAKAETAYTTVDTSVMVKISNVNANNGNFNLWITLPQMDTQLKGEALTIPDVDLQAKFNELHFFDNVVIGEKTLKEYGCTGFWENTIGFGIGEPQNIMRLHCHADPEIWSAAINSREVDYNKTEITVKEGTLIPGYTYLAGDDNPIVYRAKMDYVTRVPNPDLSYSRVTYGQTDVESMQYTTGWDSNYNNAYLGVSLKNDDYIGNGVEEVQFQNSWGSFENREEKLFTKTLLVNGETGKVTSYGLFNLGDKGKGYLSFVIRVPQTECVSITIPKGTLFPMYAMNSLKAINTHTVFMFYETQNDQVFYMKADGTFVSYAEYAVEQVENYKAEDGYFRADEAAQRAQIVATAIAAIESATTDVDIESAVTAAKEAIDALKTAAQYADEELATVKASGRDEIQNYLKDTTYLAEQTTERTQAIEAGLAAIVEAKTEEEIATAVTATKAALDAITPKQVFVDAALAELTAYKADATYYDEQKAEKDAALATATTAIQNALSKADIETAVATAKTKIDEISTIADILEEYKQGALGKINEKKATVHYDEYLEEAQAAINELYFNAKKSVKNATSEEEIDQAVAAFSEALDAIPKMNLDVQEGCGNSLGMGAVFGVLTLVGGTILLKKGKEE